MDHLDPIEFARIKASAEAFYRSVANIYCPALNAEVYFSSEGLSHFTYDGFRNRRPDSVQAIKFSCLREAIDVIKKTTTIQEFRFTTQLIGKQDSHGIKQTKLVSYYAFHAITDLSKKRRLMIVVRRIGNGNFHFWSVIPSWKNRKINKPRSERIIGSNWMLDE